MDSQIILDYLMSHSNGDIFYFYDTCPNALLLEVILKGFQLQNLQLKKFKEEEEELGSGDGKGHGSGIGYGWGDGWGGGVNYDKHNGMGEAIGFGRRGDGECPENGIFCGRNTFRAFFYVIEAKTDPHPYFLK